MTRINAVDLVVLGPPKSGTSSLFAALAAHPGVDPAHAKEPLFFSSDVGLDRGVADGHDRSGGFSRGPAWYEAMFRGASDAIRLEGTTAYFALPSSPELLAKAAPGVHGIVSLREPAQRIVSHYWHERRFAELPDLEIMVRDGHPRLDYWRRCSSYGANLARWLTVLPADQLHVVGFDQLRANVIGLANEILGVVGLEPLATDVELDDAGRNASGVSRSPRLQRLLTVSDFRSRAENLPNWIQRPLRSVARRAMQANLERSAYPDTSPSTLAALRLALEPDRATLLQLTKQHWPTVTGEVEAWPS